MAFLVWFLFCNAVVWVILRYWPPFTDYHREEYVSEHTRRFYADQVHQEQAEGTGRRGG